MKQLNLFDGEEFSEMSNTTEIQIAIKSAKLLSKEQQKFNKLSKRIEELEEEIVNIEENLQKLLNAYVKEVNPVEEKEARINIKAAFAIDKLAIEHKFSKKTKEQINDLIRHLLDQAFEVVEAKDDEIELYDRYNEVTFEEEKETQIDELKEQIEQMFFDQFKMVVDLSDVNIEDPIEMARFKNEIEEKFKEKQANENEKNRTSKKTKSKKQIEKEYLEKVKVEAQKKDLKSIYLALSKALHPDTETDPTLKLEKEELMKRVTFAYQNKDFPQLLRLELEWVHKTSDRLNQLSEEQLKIYNSMLQDRIDELSNKRLSTLWNPRFQKIHEYAHVSNKTALSKIKKEKNEIIERINILEKNLILLSKSKKKKEISDYLDFMHDIIIPYDFDWLF